MLLISFPTENAENHLEVKQESKKPGKFLGRWNGKTETRKLHKATQFEPLTSSCKNLSPLTKDTQEQVVYTSPP